MLELNQICLGTTSTNHKSVYLSADDRFRHIYALGNADTGKTNTMKSAITQDIKLGNGVLLIDSFDEIADEIFQNIPSNRKNDVILFSTNLNEIEFSLNIFDFNNQYSQNLDQAIENSFNLLNDLYDLTKTLGEKAKEYTISLIKLLLSDTNSGYTIVNFNQLLADIKYREFKLSKIQDQDLINFWNKCCTDENEVKYFNDFSIYFIAKLKPLINNGKVLNIINKAKNSINFRNAIDEQKIILISLAKGYICESSTEYLGKLIIQNIIQAGLSRSDRLKFLPDGKSENINPQNRPNFFIYIDEMHNFISGSLTRSLEEISRYRIGVYLINQFISQIIQNSSETVWHSLLANCGTLLLYKCTLKDAEYLQPIFKTLSTAQLNNPEKYAFNAIILENGIKSEPLTIKTDYLN